MQAYGTTEWLNLKMNIYFTFEEIYAFLFLASGEKQVFEAVSGCH